MSWDYLTLAEQLGISGKVTGTQLHGSCPLHENNSMNFSLNIENGKWTCFVGCGPETGRNFVMLVRLVRNCSLADALGWIRDQGREPTLEQTTTMLERLLGQLQPTREPKTDEFAAHYRNTYETGKPDLLPMSLFERGFDWPTLQQWGLRYNPLSQHLYIPIAEGADWRGLCIRQMAPGAEPKYLYNQGLKREELLFGVAQCRPPRILLVEGALDAIYLHQNGFPAAAVLGSSFSEAQAILLQRGGFGEINLGYDNDIAGLRNTERTLETLVNCGWLLANIYWVHWPDELSARTGKPIKDANDCSVAQLHQAWQQRERLI